MINVNLKDLRKRTTSFLERVIEIHRNTKFSEIGEVAPCTMFFTETKQTFVLLPPNGQDVWAPYISAIKTDVAKQFGEPVVGVLILFEANRVSEELDQEKMQSLIRWKENNPDKRLDESPFRTEDNFSAILGTPVDRVVYTAKITPQGDYRKFSSLEEMMFDDASFQGGMSTLFNFVFMNETRPVGDA